MKIQGPVRLAWSFVFLFLGCFFLSASQSLSANPTVHVIKIDDKTINPVTAEYIAKAIQLAEAENSECLIIELDTPGGLLSSTRTIVRDILSAEVPVVTYVYPNGARAGSAGVFITYASHVAAMAPSTNIGAAHPVTIGKSKARKQGLKPVYLRFLRRPRTI